MRPADALLRTAVLTQGVYYVATGMWPLVNMRSFERVTGPKIDKWLVKTVGVLVTSIGGALLVAATRRRISPEARVLAAGSAVGLAAIDVYYVAKRRIAPVYLLDAVTELALLSTAAITTDGLAANQETGRKNVAVDRV
jgi:hypothetical protein